MWFRFVLVWILGLILAAQNAWSAKSPTADELFAQTECSELLTDFSVQLQEYLLTNAAEYSALKHRVLNAPQAPSERDFKLIMLKFVHTFMAFRERIHHSRFYEGKLIADYFLQGVTVWAENYQDLILANEVFYHTYDPQSDGPGASSLDLDLVYFAARMAWVADRYEQFKGRRLAKPINGSGKHSAYDESDRRRSLFELDMFDATNANELNIHCEHRTLRVFIDGDGPYVHQRLRERRIRVEDPPVTSLGLRFNNGRRANLYDIEAPEYWVASYLSRVFSDEIWLGLGDLGVRQFFPLIMKREGYLVRFPRAADFLTVSLHPDNDRRIFNIRELKFASPWTPTVDIQSALEQMESTWVALNTAYGAKEVGIPVLEVLIPRRDSKTGSAFGEGYSMGPEVDYRAGSRLHQLVKDGVPVSLTVDGTSVPIMLREIPMSAADYRRLADEKK